MTRAKCIRNIWMNQLYALAFRCVLIICTFIVQDCFLIFWPTCKFITLPSLSNVDFNLIALHIFNLNFDFAKEKWRGSECTRPILDLRCMLHPVWGESTKSFNIDAILQQAEKGENRIKSDKRYFHWKNFVLLQFVVDWLFAYRCLYLYLCLYISMCAFRRNMHSTSDDPFFLSQRNLSIRHSSNIFNSVSLHCMLHYMLIYFVQLVWLNLLSFAITVQSLLLDFV